MVEDKMIVEKLNESGYECALYGLSLSRRQPKEKMHQVAASLAPLGGGHNKFLEHICTWWRIKASRDWWQEMDTYRHASKQSESTVYLITKRHLTNSDFMIDIPLDYLEYLNGLIDKNMWYEVKKSLPEGFLQEREVFLNYQTLRNIYHQRRGHKMKDWHYFLWKATEQIEFPWLVIGTKEKK